MLEILTIIISLILYFVKTTNENVTSILSTLAVFGLGSYKLLPAFQDIYYNFSTIKSSLPAYKAINKYLDQANQFKETQSESKYPLYRTKIPWDFKIAWSFTYSNRKQERTISNNSLMFSSNVTLTPKWQVSASSGYDFKGKGFTYTSLGFDRDLNSWRMSFDWVPFSNRASWNFFIGIKSGLLSDIKYDKNREPDRKLN